MRVIIKRQTRWNGAALRPGETVEIGDAVALRWINNGIAVENIQTLTVETSITPDEPEIVDIEGMSFNEMKAYAAKELGLKVPSKTKKAELIGMIKNALDADLAVEKESAEASTEKKSPSSPDGAGDET